MESVEQKSVPSDFEFMTLIGEGSVGKVFKARKVSDGEFYAIKVIKKKAIVTAKDTQFVMGERNIMMNKHPFLIRMFECFQTNSKLYFVLEFINGGELYYHLSIARVFPEERAKFYSAELVSALSFLHGHQIIYRDLKLENILIDSEGHIKLTDFGLSRQGLALGDKAFSFCGTKTYMSPEVLKKAGYNKEVDWWCLGIVLHEMLFSFPPFYHEDPEILFHLILEKPLRLKSKPPISEECKSVLRDLLQRDPKDRLGSGADGLASIQNHPFFQEINFKELNEKKLTPPWLPGVENGGDTRHIDSGFLDQAFGTSVATSMFTKRGEDKQFEGFSYSRRIHAQCIQEDEDN